LSLRKQKLKRSTPIWVRKVALSKFIEQIRPLAKNLQDSLHAHEAGGLAKLPPTSPRPLWQA